MTAPVTPLRELLSLVLPHIPDCPQMVATYNLRLAAIEFCERTRAWRHIVTQPVTPGGSPVDAPDWGDIYEDFAATPGSFGNGDTAPERNGQKIIVAPQHATIHQIEHAEIDGHPLTPIAYTDISALPKGGFATRYITQVDTTGVLLLPDCEGELTVSVFLKPRYGSDHTQTDNSLDDYYDVIPDFLAAQHGEVIAHGALSRLFAMPKSDWFSPQLAQFYGTSFERRAEKGGSNSLRGQQRAKIRSKTVWF